MAVEKQKGNPEQDGGPHAPAVAHIQKEQLEKYAKEAGLVPISIVKGYLFPLKEDKVPHTDDLGTLVLTHDAALEKEVLARTATDVVAEDRTLIKDALAHQVGKVIAEVLLGRRDMQAGRQLLRKTFGEYGGKEQAAYQDNELRPFADRFRQVAEAVHQELIAMANRVG